MKKILLFLLKYLIFWLLYFLLSKLVFLLFNFHLTRELDFTELAGIFRYGVKMDLSTASYLTVFPGLFMFFAFLLPARSLKLLLKIYTLVILGVVTFINGIDLSLYPHWGTRIGISAFGYLDDSEGLVSSVTLKEIARVLAAFFLYFFLFSWLFRRFLLKELNELGKPKWYYSPVVLFLTACLFIPIRGGLGTTPINLSTVSFSDKFYANQVAANYLWNFAKTVEKRNSLKNPFKYTSNKEAWDAFYHVENTRTNGDFILIRSGKDDSPNVLLIILESFSSRIISSFGGDYDICPNLDSICTEGIIFPSFYATGNRSDRGLSALLGGYPSLLDMSIMRFPDKSEKLTMISDYFNHHNYYTSFYYGGDIDFYNLKSFVLQGGYNRITAKNDFPVKLQKMSSWGVPDSYLFDRVLTDLQQNNSSPFFTVAYTLSSHTPFDVPVVLVEGNTAEAKFLNALAYTDRCIGDFIRSLKRTDLWENTLVIITADHGSHHPGQKDIIEPETYRIPLIWTGGVVNEPAVIDCVGGQTDLIPTLLNQLNWESDSLLFGHNLFSLPSYAFYMLDLGWGYITNSGAYFYNQKTEQLIPVKQDKNLSPGINFAKAYIQVLHDDFISK